MFSRVAGLLIPCLAVLIAKTAGLTGAFAPDQRARTSQPPPAEYGPLPTAHAWLLNRREAAARLGVSPGSNNFGGEPWDNPVYLHDPAEFDRVSGDPCNAPLNWRRDLGCPGENLFTKAEVRDGSLQSGGGIAPPVRRSRRIDSSRRLGRNADHNPTRKRGQLGPASLAYASGYDRRSGLWSWSFLCHHDVGDVFSDRSRMSATDASARMSAALTRMMSVLGASYTLGSKGVRRLWGRLCPIGCPTACFNCHPHHILHQKGRSSADVARPGRFLKLAFLFVAG